MVRFIYLYDPTEIIVTTARDSYCLILMLVSHTPITPITLFSID